MLPIYVIFRTIWGNVFNAFLEFLQLATAYTPKRIFTKNTPKDVIPAKDVPFGGPDDHI